MKKVCAVEDAATACCNFFIAKSGNLITEFSVAASGIYNMGVGVAETRHHEAAIRVEIFSVCGCSGIQNNPSHDFVAAVRCKSPRGCLLIAHDPCGQGGSTVFSPSTQSASSRINVTDNSALGLPRAVIRMACSKGTYVRAFARDLGEKLGSGAHLDSLQRSRSGEFRVENALTVDQAIALLNAATPNQL